MQWFCNAIQVIPHFVKHNKLISLLAELSIKTNGLTVGIPRYPGPYPPMIRPGFPPRPLPPMGVIPQILLPPIPGIRGPPVVSPVVRPFVPAVATEKPQTTVYVSKIALTVDNDFLLSLLRLCGPVKSWKRAQNPSDGSPTSFGFCEFEAAEGILRALRLLTKLNIDGQELGIKIKAKVNITWICIVAVK
ncbi:uncharacterized protein A4U43_C07F17190 [Asparagus officinalis]|uniref:RRM domain-containing protein n=1 Tax=Asparagus officinalis TaxID=4686 RepID=A0A5P1ECX9_ASPOF|nr:uncharacterized protein A4U43_C07F17190 [Asparagus officinalis]